MTARKRIWGWFFFDWASQPYSTLLIAFIFAPYIKEIIGDGAQAQATWGFTVGAAGICIALMAPIQGAVADIYGNRVRWIWVFSLFYVVGAAGLWLAVPADYPLMLILFCFAFGLVGMEFATIFTNSMLPDLGPREDIGRISGKGWAFGYTGGLLALVAMLLLFAESATTGKTLLGIDPILGLDAAAREGTRFVGPFTAIWYLIFVIPFFLWVRDPKPAQAPEGALRTALRAGAPDDVINFRRIEIVAITDRAEHGRAEMLGVKMRQCALPLFANSARGATCINDIGFSHLNSPICDLVSLICFTCTSTTSRDVA